MRVLYNEMEKNAKRFKDLTPEEIKASTNNPNLWDKNDIFVQDEKEDTISLLYVFDSEVEIISE